VLDGQSPPHRSYRALLESEAGSAHVHDVLLAVTVEAARAGRAVRAAGGGDSGACSVLLREAASVRRLLADAGVDAGEILSCSALAGVLHRGFTPEPARDSTREFAREPTPGVAPERPAWPWPMAVEGSWTRARVDGTWHVTYWIAEWPRRDMGPDFLGPLLVSDVRRTVALVMQPMTALEAARRVEQARTADIADAELRRRGGFLATARRRREQDVLASREAELADGHAQYRFTGYVTVTAADPEALDDACARTEHAAGRAGLELRRCYGDQARAFTCTLPLGRGLP
jgi:type VII ESX secretion system EccE translocon-like protein